ncbi:amidase domain-containing protein [Leifsonia sp. YAF41]|uniref:amidase domain-containing protein n=1 Tax=Leifsonia sp. YAF41 TaxID=3233086 RepID=UPI003F951B1E
MAFSRTARRGITAVLIGGLVVGGAVFAMQFADGADYFGLGGGGQSGSGAPGSSGGSASDAQPQDAAVEAQLAYVLKHWKHYNTAEYGVVPDNDCVDFASQSLIVRGWTMDDDWWTEGTGDDFDFSSAWVSSTAFRDYLEESGRATALSDSERDQVKLGDIAQFDWDNSGDRDHTAVVTRIEGTGDNIKIYYAGHTDDTDYRSVDWAITTNHPGASVYYWSIP